MQSIEGMPTIMEEDQAFDDDDLVEKEKLRNLLLTKYEEAASAHDSHSMLNSDREGGGAY